MDQPGVDLVLSALVTRPVRDTSDSSWDGEGVDLVSSPKDHTFERITFEMGLS